MKHRIEVFAFGSQGGFVVSPCAEFDDACRIELQTFCRGDGRITIRIHTLGHDTTTALAEAFEGMAERLRAAVNKTNSRAAKARKRRAKP